MKKVLAIALALAMLLGLSGTAFAAVTQEDIIGVWDMDIVGMANMMGMDEEMESMLPLLQLMNYTMEFTADGKYIMLMSAFGEEEKTEGTYVIEDGKISMDGGFATDITLENDVLTITEDGATLTFTRSTGKTVSEEEQMAALMALLGGGAEPDVGMLPVDPVEPDEPAEPVAGGKLEIVQENLHFVKSYSNYDLYLYAKVQNVGDREIKLNDSVLEVYNANGEVVASKEYGDANAAYLLPGEYTYLEMVIYDQLTEEPTNYKLTVVERTDKDTRNDRYPVTTDLQLGVEQGYRTVDYMYATVTNPTNETVYDMEVALTLLDDAGNILLMEDQMFFDMGLCPGSSMTVRIEIEEYMKDYFEENGLKPAVVDAIAFTEVDLDD